MKKIEVKDLDELVDVFLNCLDVIEDDIGSDYPCISIYGKYDVIRDILEELIRNGASITDIELEDYDVSFYDKEFILCLVKDEHITVSVDKAWHNNRYYKDVPDVAFVHSDCSSKLLKYIDSDFVYEFEIDDKYEDTGSKSDVCACCGHSSCDDTGKFEKYVEYAKDDNGDMHGFTASKSDGSSYSAYSFYTTDKLSKTDIQSIMLEAGF